MYFTSILSSWQTYKNENTEHNFDYNYMHSTLDVDYRINSNSLEFIGTSY